MSTIVNVENLLDPELRPVLDAFELPAIDAEGVAERVGDIVLQCSGTPGAILPRADDDVGAADGEGFDTKRGQNFELSRWGLRSHSAPVP